MVGPQALQAKALDAEKRVAKVVAERDRALAKAAEASLEYKHTLEQCEAEFQAHFDRVDLEMQEVTLQWSCDKREKNLLYDTLEITH